MKAHNIAHYAEVVLICTIFLLCALPKRVYVLIGFLLFVYCMTK